jgi:hypothetical protein
MLSVRWPARASGLSFSISEENANPPSISEEDTSPTAASEDKMIRELYRNAVLPAPHSIVSEDFADNRANGPTMPHLF